MDVRVGLCGWTLSQTTYVRRFPLVEVQHTFYEPPPDAVLMRWRASVPPAFEFTMKSWQLVTHESGSPTYRRLKQPLPEDARGQVGAFRTTPPVLAGWQRTLECARLLWEPRGTWPVSLLRRLRDLVTGQPHPYVLFNNLPRVGDAERFLALL